MAQASDQPILHIVDSAAVALRSLDISAGKIGVMGTAATLAMRLYQNRLSGQGWDCIVPDDDQMREKVSPAIASVKANRVSDAFEPLLEVANDLVQRGARAVVLGCTEIPLGIAAGPADRLHSPIVDTIDSLARASIEWALGQR
jgi:aspartate racemase